MCAGSESKLGNEDVDIYMGYYGGSITVGDLHYSVNTKETECTKEEMIAALGKYSKEELAACIVDLIDNSNE